MGLTDASTTFVDGINSGCWDVDNIGDFVEGMIASRTQAQCLTPLNWRPFMSLHDPIELPHL